MLKESDSISFELFVDVFSKQLKEEAINEIGV